LDLQGNHVRRRKLNAEIICLQFGGDMWLKLRLTWLRAYLEG